MNVTALQWLHSKGVVASACVFLAVARLLSALCYVDVNHSWMLSDFSIYKSNQVKSSRK